MRVRYRKQTSTRRQCASVAITSLVVTCVFLCPVYRAIMNSLIIIQVSETLATPHSLEHQLLQSKNGTSTAAFLSVSTADEGRVANGKEVVMQQQEQQVHGLNVKIPIVDKDTEVLVIENEDSLGGEKTEDVPVPTRESFESHQESHNGALLRKSSQAREKNIPPLIRESSNDRDERRHKELEAIVDKLRLKLDVNNNNNNNNSSARRVPDPTLGSEVPVPLSNSTSKNTLVQASNLQEEQLTSGRRPKTLEPLPLAHNPTFFSEHAPLSSLKRRMNLLTPYTGCSIAAHQYNLGKHAHPEFNDCFVHCGKPFAKTRGIRVDNAHELVKENDTIFVQFNKLFHFVNKTMDSIDVDYVLISGNEQKVPAIDKGDFDAIVNNPRIIHWFMSNMDIYSHDLNHAKISPWPYGSNPKKLAYLANELQADPPEREHAIYLSGFSRATNPQRFHIPNGPQVPIEQYLRDFRSSKYVISPDGDRPECYRHYEAIAMGCMPITQMDAKTHSHLKNQVVFNNSNWNLTSLAVSLPPNPKVNQRLIFEEYWMEYVERIVGRPLRWYDPSRDVHSSLTEIQNLIANDIVETRDEMCVVANGAPFVGRRASPDEAYKIS